jgi:hypothetical protein
LKRGELLVNRKLFPVGQHDEAPRDEVERILDALRELTEQAPSPVVRVCLEEARQDIAHLAGAGNEYEVHDEQPAAADQHLAA